MNILKFSQKAMESVFIAQNMNDQLNYNFELIYYRSRFVLIFCR